MVISSSAAKEKNHRRLATGDDGGGGGGFMAAKLVHPSSPSRRFSQSRLHNFSFPTLSWGSQRLLRCANLPPGTAGEPAGSEREEASPPSRKRPSSPSSSSLDKEAANHTPTRIPGNEDGEEAQESSPAAAAARPWNLRTRRSACSAPAAEIGRNRSTVGSYSCSPSSPVRQLERTGLVKSLRSRSENLEKEERCRFSISLTREEIEEDFLALKGTKPPRRPKKRAKIVQRQLDSLFPGLWLSEITPDSYKIDE